jgi:hypothetical protein
MKPLPILVLAVLGTVIHPGLAGAAVEVRQQAGGVPRDAVTVGDLVYLDEGPAVRTWRLSSDGSTAPQPLSVTAPLPGLIQGLAIKGNVLFASWRGDNPTGELALYSLADPERPVFLRHFSYSTNPFRSPGGIVLAGDHLYLADSESGVFTLDVTDPLDPAVISTLETFGLQRLAVTGTVLVAWGRSFLGGLLVETLSLADPANPASVGFYSGGNLFSGAVAGDLLVLVGDGMDVVSLADPANPALLANEPSVVGMGVLLHGGRAYVGTPQGLQVWNLTNPGSPVEVGVTPAPVERTLVAKGLAGDRALFFTETGQGLELDLAAVDAPVVDHSFDLPVGADSTGVVPTAGGVLVSDFYSGLRVAGPGLASVGRLDPPIFQGAFEDVAVEGNLGLLAAWGSGLLTVDLTDPAAPSQLGLLPFPFATAVAVQGSFAYLVSSTNGGVFAVVDLTDPANPQQRGSFNISKGLDVVFHQGLALVADEAAFGTGGLRVVDAGNPDQPQQVSHYTTCDSAGGVAAQGNLVAVACRDGSLHLVDLANPASPVQLGVYTDPEMFLQGNAVALDGTTAYFGHNSGIDVVDISQPGSPVLRRRLALAGAVRDLTLAQSGMVWAAAGPAGVYQLEASLFNDGFESGDTAAWGRAVP